MWTYREPTSTTKRQYRRRSVTAQSTWKKSVARMVAAWACRNSRHVVSLFRFGAGGIRRALRTRRIVEAPRSTDETLPPQVLRLSAGRAMLSCMTAQHHQPPVTDRPAETPAAIRAALAASAVPEVLAQYETELDAAFTQARETGDVTVLTSVVRRWWVEALEWQRDPAGQRDFLARMERYLAEGPSGPEHRVTREEFRAQLGA